MQELRRMVAASEHVHALVTAVLPSVAAGQRRGPVEWDRVTDAMGKYTMDPEMVQVQQSAVRALCALGIRDDSEVGVTMMTFATKLASFIVLYAGQIQMDPERLWSEYVSEFAVGSSRL